MSNKKLSLAELMGTAGSQGSKKGLSLSHLPEILGNAMPELPRNPVGRHRLIRSLQQRFGPNFRTLPGVSNIIAEFDKDLEFEKHVAHMKEIKYKRGSK